MMFQLHQWWGLTTISLGSVLVLTDLHRILHCSHSWIVIKEGVKRFPIKTPNFRCSKGSDQITKNGGSLAQDVAGTLRPFPQENTWLENKAKWIHKKLKIHCSLHRGTCRRGPSYFNKIRANSEKNTCQNKLTHFKNQTALSFLFWRSWLLFF